AEAEQITDLTATQEQGYATLRWSPVEGAEQYSIERTPVGADNVPTGAAKIVGTWRPNRQVPGLPPTFAEAGFVPGERYQWRVRPVVGTLPNQIVVNAPSSAAGTYGVTQATFGPAFPAGGI